MRKGTLVLRSRGLERPLPHGYPEVPTKGPGDQGDGEKQKPAAKHCPPQVPQHHADCPQGSEAAAPGLSAKAPRPQGLEPRLLPSHSPLSGQPLGGGTQLLIP